MSYIKLCALLQSSSFPQEPIIQSVMETTPSNTEKEYAGILLDIETASNILNL